MLAIHGDHLQESIADVPPHKVIKDLRNYSYYAEPHGIIWAHSGNTCNLSLRTDTHTHTHTIIQTACCKEAIENVRRYAPSSRFRFRRRDRNVYIPRVRENDREKGKVRGSQPVSQSKVEGEELAEGSTPGIGSIADSHTCARASTVARARRDTCVHATV